MGWSRRSLWTEIEESLGRLPQGFATTTIGDAHFVVGPTGAFVVLAHDSTPERARSLARLSATVRSVLAQSMSWVPFVHALLVSTESVTAAQATVVPPDLLVEVLTEGRQTLEDETFARIVELMESGLLDGLESLAPVAFDARVASHDIGTGAHDARMTPCASDRPMASTSPSTTSLPISAVGGPSSPMPRGFTAGSGFPSPHT